MRTKIAYRFLITVLLFIVPLTTHNCQLSANNRNFFSPHNRLQFGNYLYKDKDYLRAADEFKVYLKSVYNDTIVFRLANSYFKIGRYTEAADNFKGLFFGSQLSEEARLLFYETIFFQKDYKLFRELAEEKNFNSSQYGKDIERLKYTSYFLDTSILPDENVVLKNFPDSVQSQLINFYQQKKYPQHKSPTTAVILSALIPGAGKIYTGEVGDGVTSLIVTALTTYLAVANFNADHQFRGWLFSGLAAFFYAGNIYGSAASAQIYNARIQFNFDKEVKLFFEQRNYFLPKVDY
ncbi:MAG: hypothetical protein NTZ27_12910 [Ignavibacteriales bacterium]|nr:hypothetical protein [Ignavibacteriales bacterium]